MARIGDRKYMQPSYAGKNDQEESKLPATVRAIYGKRFALMDFGGFCECFPLSEVDAAVKVGKRRITNA